MPTSLPRRRSSKDRSLETALGVAILVECITLFVLAPRGPVGGGAPPPMTMEEQALARMPDALLAP